METFTSEKYVTAYINAEVKAQYRQEKLVIQRRPKYFKKNKNEMKSYHDGKI